MRDAGGGDIGFPTLENVVGYITVTNGWKKALGLVVYIHETSYLKCPTCPFSGIFWNRSLFPDDERRKQVQKQVGSVANARYRRAGLQGRVSVWNKNWLLFCLLWSCHILPFLLLPYLALPCLVSYLALSSLLFVMTFLSVILVAQRRHPVCHHGIRRRCCFSSGLVLPCRDVSCPLLSSLLLSSHVFSCLALSSLALSCFALPCLVLSCVVLSCALFLSCDSAW
jgi:hypothetical protein